ncbi:DivIVA domain-containing protein [Ornithinimicrobium cavernae]|uniref:DivIVA domain-containing protein n=1 Tax=Ornithinimicrobium cavernae TaxID=2666047 RepID=UPI00137AFB09|nr:DivIVA domain-containing protein [Ornithinimicrobium cavernae]
MSEQRGRPAFRTTGFLRQGYQVEDVDDFLDEVFDALAGGRPVPDIGGARFRNRRGGYEVSEVDAFLDELAAELG